MAVNAGTISVQVMANVQGIVAGMNKAKAAVQDFSVQTQALMEANAQAMTNMGRKSMLMGAAMLAGPTLAVKSFASLEQAMATATAVSDTTEQQLADMTQMAEQMSKKLGVAATDTAQAFYFLGSAGLSVQNQIAAFPAVATLARASMMDMGSTAEITVDTMKGFKIPFTEAVRVTDILTRAVTSSNMTFSQLGESMSLVAGVARNSNMTLEETTAILGLMANVGIKGSMAGTSLRRALINLGAPSSEAARTLKSLGVEVFNSEGKMITMTEVMEQLVPALKSAGEETRNMALKQLFGARAITGMTELVFQGAEGMREFTKEVRTGGTTAESVAKKQLDTLTGSVIKLGQQVAAISRVFGQDFVPAVGSTTETLTELLKKIEAMPAPMRMAIGGTTALTGSMLLAGGSLIFMMGQVGHAILGWKALTLAAPNVVKAILAIRTAAISGALGIGAITLAGGLLISNMIKRIDAFRSESKVLEAEGAVVERITQRYNNLNKQFRAGELSSEKYQKQVRILNTMLSDMDKKNVKPLGIDTGANPATAAGTGTPRLNVMNFSIKMNGGREEVMQQFKRELDKIPI